MSDSNQTISTKQKQIAELARTLRGKTLTSLNRHLDLPLLRAAYERTRKDGAVGVDGVTAEDYEAELETNLASLLDRAKSGRYRAPAVRRVYIPKAGGKQRPLGIPTLEDKILQRAVLLLLEPVYEQDFLSCSYGFRPGRSAHQATQEIQRVLTRHGGGTVLDVDIQSFFDDLDHQHLRELIRQRVRDGVLLRLIGKWLKAGILDQGVLSYPTSGTPQGGVISPLLANIYLHYVLDGWFRLVAADHLDGPAYLIRYADDFVLIFARDDDATRIEAVLTKRFAKYGLTLHPAKTRRVDFRRPRDDPEKNDRSKPPGPSSFDFLGFTFHWGRSRKGNWVVRQKTAKSRLARSIQSARSWCRLHRHDPVAAQHTRLSRGLRGHYTYYGVTGNNRSLDLFYRQVIRAWFTWLQRRAQRRRLSWDRFGAMLKRYPLPRPRIVHSIYRLGANP